MISKIGSPGVISYCLGCKDHTQAILKMLSVVIFKKMWFNTQAKVTSIA